MEIFDELLICARKFYIQIVGIENATPIDFYVGADNLAAFLSTKTPVSPAQAREILLGFSKDQKPTVDFWGFYGLIENIMSRNYPLMLELDALLGVASEVITGEPALFEDLIINSLFSCIPQIEIEDSPLSEKVKDFCLPSAIDLIFSVDQLLTSFKTSLTKKSDVLRQLDTVFGAIEKITNIEILGSELINLKSTLSFLCSNKTPHKFVRTSIIAQFVFKKFVESNLLQTLTAHMQQISPAQIDYAMKHQSQIIQSAIFSIFMIFLSLFRYKSNFSAYNQIMANCSFSFDFLRQFVSELAVHTSNVVIREYAEPNYGPFLCLIANLE